jgi:transcriptional regulator with XRE-family HTH domain
MDAEEPRRLTQDPRRLYLKRAEAGLTSKDLAKRAGVNPATIWRLENGNRSARADILGRLARALGCPVTDLMPDEVDAA